MKTQLALPGDTTRSAKSSASASSAKRSVADRSHVRHQPALGRAPGDAIGSRIEQYHCSGWKTWLLRRLCRSRGGDRGAGHPRRRRRIRLRRGAVPPHAGARSVDIVMIDLMRAAHHAVAQDRRHGAGIQPAGGEPPGARIHVHLIAAIPNGLTVEYMPWSARLFRSAAAAKRRACRSGWAVSGLIRPRRDQALRRGA